MRAFLVALVCSGAILGQTASAQTDSQAPSTSAQTATPAATTTVAPSQAATAAAETAPATASQPTMTATKQAPETVVVQADKVNLDEIVCRNSAPATGTRLGGGRECHSVREWNQREKQAQDITRQQENMGFNSGGH